MNTIIIDDLTAAALDSTDDFTDIACPICGKIDPFTEDECDCQAAVIEPFAASDSHPLLQREADRIAYEQSIGFDAFENPDTFDLSECGEWDEVAA